MKGMLRMGIAMATVAMGVGCEGAGPDRIASGVVGQDVKTSTPVIKRVAQVNLTANKSDEFSSRVQDPLLRNGWGLAFAPSGPAWVSSAEEGVARIYNSSGEPADLTVRFLDETGKEKRTPTGVVFNGGDGFNKDRFIFATEDGFIYGWTPASDPTMAIQRFDSSGAGAIYKGIAILTTNDRSFIYATDFHNGRVDVFDENYHPLHSGGGVFKDPTLPKGYAPFNVMGAAGLLFVTYALQDENAEDDVKGDGHGFVNVFDPTGHLHARLLSGGALNSPWGMTFAAPALGEAVRLLVGNFGDGRINAFTISLSDVKTGARFEGALGDADGHPISIDGLWGIAFGTGRAGFRAEDLYFSAGPNDEEDGLFGRLEPVTTSD